MIGLFDSGFGGLTILHGILDALPQYPYMYLGDNARAPYGSRHREEIVAYTREGAAYLFDQGCSVVILACNTASAQALRELQQAWLPHAYPGKHLLGIVVPTIEQITGLPWQHGGRGSKGVRYPVEKVPDPLNPLPVLTVGVLATEQTIAAGAYEHEIHKRNPAIRVVQQACPALVPLIEQGAEAAALAATIHTYVAQLLAQAAGGPPLQAVLLGCTHYALIADLIAAVLPMHVTLYEQPKIVAQSLREYLKRHPELVRALDQSGQRTFLTTGDDKHTTARSQQFFGKPVAFTKVAL